MFTPTQIQTIVQHVREHAAGEYPFECCGLIDPQGTAFRCTNVAHDRARSFRVCETDAKRLTRVGEIAGVYHSHVDERAYLSKADREGFTANGLHVVAACVKGVVTDVQVWYHDRGQLARVSF